MSETLHPAVDEEAIERLVRHFYGRIRIDPVLAPIFEAVISDDWEPHLQKMMAFWSSVLLMSGRFKGQPMERHQALINRNEINVRPEHFARWLKLFGESAHAIFSQETARSIIGRAERIAESLKRGMFNLNPDTCAA